MTSDDILDMIGDAKGKYIWDAHSIRSAAAPKRKTIPMKCIWLIAALVAVMLLLVGCVTVYLRLQDLSFGKKTYVEEYNSQGLYIGPTEKTKDFLTVNGYVGSPHQLAVQEWMTFQETYDPNHDLLTNEPDIPEIPNAEEAIYGCYTVDMVEKLHEIVKKYDLKLLDEWVPIQRWQNDIALNALGIDSFLKEGAKAELPDFSGMLYPPYSFHFEYGLTMTGEDALWTQEMMVRETYERKGYFHPRSYWFMDLSRVKQWNYRTTDGYDLLLVLDDRGNGYILLEKEEAYLTINLSTYRGQSKYPTPEEYISKEGLEQAAELFDYSVSTPDMDIPALRSELDAAEEAYMETRPRYELPSYRSFDECMKREGVWRGPDGQDYAFYDEDADGEAELIFGWNGKPVWGIDIENGETLNRVYSGIDFCENGILHSVTTYDFSTYEFHTFSNWPEFSLCLIRKNGVWHKGEEPVDYASVDTLPVLTDEEAQAIIDSYPHVELDWYPVMDYPFADGTIVADYVPEPEPTVPITLDRLNEVYRETARNETWLGTPYTHYWLHDLDGDGIEELLLSYDGQTICAVFGLRNGKIVEIRTGVGEFLYPCEGGVWEETLLMNTEGGVELEEHMFYHMKDGSPEPLHYVAWNKATASWVCDRDYTPISESEAKAILARYPRIPIQFRPIAEWAE